VTRFAALRIALCAGIAPASLPAAAQDVDEQLWGQAGVIFSQDDWEFGANIVTRAGNAAEGVYQLQFNLDVGRELGGGLAGGIGYSYVPSYRQGRLTTREHRIRQQIGTSIGRVLGGDLEGRLRLEQRWRDDGEDIKLRLRPRVTWTRPIGPDGLKLRLLHESFVNVNETDWGGESRYDRMRNQAALQRDLGGGLSGEVGYLNQYILGRGQADEVDHALTIALTLRL
jgi:hypothetical protein